MRTTVRIDDDLLSDLKARARREKLSLNRLMNLLLRRGLADARVRPPARYREKARPMGQPLFDLDKALALAAALDDEQTVTKLVARK